MRTVSMTASPSSIVIPQDIIDSIIHELPADSKAVLKRCCLVSHAFLQPSQRKLFSTVTLTTEWQCSHLHSALTSNPDFPSYIRALTVVEAALTTVRLVPILRKLLKLEKLQSLSIILSSFYAQYPFTTKMQPLLDFCKLPCLVSLTIKQANAIPFIHLRECRQLKHLALVACSSTTNDDAEAQLSSSMLSNMSVSTTAYLDSLRIWDSAPRLRSMIDALGCPWCLSRLRKLSITDRNENDAQDITEILKAVARTLQTFEWFACPIWSSHGYLKIPLHLMSNLRSLCFIASDHDSSILIGMARLTEAIRDMPPGSITEEISVTLYITNVLDYAKLHSLVGIAFWSSLDSALGFADLRLRRVSIYFNISYAHLASSQIKMAADQAYWRLFNKMPLLHKAGILRAQAGVGLLVDEN